MLWLSLSRYFAAAVLLADSATGPTRTWIADIKANRATLAGQEVQLEGEVVDLRSTSPTARRGFYRLTDASDPAGVLVRTERLPMDGGSFRLTARVAPEQLVEGAMLVDELERKQTDGRPLLPVVAMVVSALGLVASGLMLRRSVREERAYLVSPPLWLLPEAGPYGKALPAPVPGQVPLKYQPELEEADRFRRDQLRKARRWSARAMFTSFAITGLSAWWVFDTQPVAGQVPAFIFIDANDPAARAARRAPDTPTAPDQLVVNDSALLAALNAPPPAPVETRRTRRDSTAAERPARLSVGDTVVSALEPRHDSLRAVEPPRADPVPAPAPAPAPAPPPEVSEPVRDPAVERARAADALSAGAAKLVAAINQKQLAALAILLQGGDASRRDKFLKLVLDFGPRATLGPLGSTEVDGDRAEVGFTMQLSWRGDFGLDKKKGGRLLGTAHRQGNEWQFDGARLLDPIP